MHFVSIFYLSITFIWKIVVVKADENTQGRIGRDLFKGYSGFRLYNNSFRMIYYHDLTISVIEIGDGMILENCELIEVFSDEQRKHALHALTKIIGRPLQLSFKDMMDLMNQCDSLDFKLINGKISNLTPNSGTSSEPSDATGSQQSSFLSGIFPGTKWCGAGDIAKNYFDLGPEWIMDKCCRKHDLCPIKVKGNGTRYNLTNKSVYTKSHCVCDDEFLNCLRRTDRPAADFMGNIYFNIIQIPCIQDSKNGKQYRSSKRY